MLIGINATAAFKEPRTGVEEYTYQLIKYLAMLKENQRHRFILYTGDKPRFPISNFQIPGNFIIKKLKWPLPMWTQIRLASEMLWHKPDVLFIPVHVLPRLCPENSIVTVHGLEYEYYPEMYPGAHRRYIRWATRDALKRGRRIIAVSENTKKDLVKLYNADPNKIEVVYHGVEIANRRTQIINKPQKQNPYILFIGRLERKKNIEGILEAYKMLKQKYRISHSLVLAGAPGYGYDVLKSKIKNPKLKIIETGYVNENKKWQLLYGADAFVLPSFYEGFGMPILEAQAAGCPVITSNVSSMPEVAGEGAVLVEPKNIEEICEAMYKVINDKELRNDLIDKGYENIKKFSWQKCAEATLKVLTK
jgi:glycosyltransferase involved in cell wall biosynthesis